MVFPQQFVSVVGLLVQTLLLLLIGPMVFINVVHSFQIITPSITTSSTPRITTVPILGQPLLLPTKPTTLFSSVTGVDDTTVTSEKVEDVKRRLLQLCQTSGKSNTDDSMKKEIRTLIQELEETSELCGIGQSSSFTGLIAGEWELVYSSTDITRSSPFFWALRKALEQQTGTTSTTNWADQIYAITDSIPAPFKELGPSIQRIDLNGGGTTTGRFVSQVQVSTLNGLASSIMTTRGTIIGYDGIDGLKIRIDTTKPERNTLLASVPFIGDVLNENLPAYPSGVTLEQLSPGSSEIIMRTTFCDETIRISKNNDRPKDEYFIWTRKEFASYNFL